MSGTKSGAPIAAETPGDGVPTDRLDIVRDGLAVHTVHRAPHPPFEPDSPHVDAVRPAVNRGRRQGEGFERTGRPDMLLLHYTGMDGPGERALGWLCSPRSVVSAHYFVFEDGRIVQTLPESVRAQHAGLSFWHGERDNNSRSIGVEIAHPGHLEVGRGGVLRPFPPEQIDAVARLCADIVARLAIPHERVLAHSDIAPERKQDPGELFPWRVLHERGAGHWVEPAPLRAGTFFQEGDRGQPVEALQAMLARYGYNAPVTGTFDAQTRLCVLAFQRHFRPERVDGIADPSTVQTLYEALKALPARA